MSTYISRFLIKGYEDYDSYQCISCTLKHWPSMWDGEKQAEHGIWEERYKLIQANKSCGFATPHVKKTKGKYTITEYLEVISKDKKK